MQGRHETVLGFERQHVNAREPLAQFGGTQSRLGPKHDQSALHRIALDLPLLVDLAQCRVVAQGGCETQFVDDRPLIERRVVDLQQEAAMRVIADAAHRQHSLDGDQCLYRHLVAGQRAGLVRADRADRAQCLDCRQAADDGPLCGHSLHANGQCDRDDCRQPLGDGRHRQPHRGEKHLLQRVAAYGHAKHGSGGGNRENRQSEGARELAHLSRQWRGQGLDLFQQRADAPDLGLFTGPRDHAKPLAGSDQGARIGHAETVAECRFFRHLFCLLSHCQRFAGQHRLVDLQFAQLVKAQVGRYAIAGLNEHHVTGDQVFGGNAETGAIAHDHRLR